MDSFGDHALVCQCNGDRTVRHNALRNVVCADATQGNMNPEREKQGLLPRRPGDDGVHGGEGHLDDAEGDQTQEDHRQGRRPADVFLPRGVGGLPVALDFACTSGLRADRLRLATENPELVVESYEAFKSDFKPLGEEHTTAVLCRQQGFRFTPMVIEAHSGGWGRTARQVLDSIAKQVSASWNDLPEAASLALAQRLSITLHRENARAVLRRRRETAPPDDDTP